MANMNTFASITNLPAQVVNAATATLLTQTVNGVTGTAVLAMPPNANVDGHAFRVRLVGKATGNANTLLFTILSGTTPLAVYTAGTGVATTGTNFSVVADLSWDSVSGLLNGTLGGQIARVISPAAATAAVPVITSAAGIQFSASATFSTASALNTVTVTEFTLEQI